MNIEFQSLIMKFQIMKQIIYQKILTKIIDLKDHKQLEKIFLRNKPDTIFHAAASKHVDLIEKNPEYGVKNNIY